MKAEKIRWILLQAFTEGITISQTDYDEVLEEIYEVERLTKIGETFEYFMTSPDVDEYVVVSIDKREYDTIEDVMSQYEYYKEWQK